MYVDVAVNSCLLEYLPSDLFLPQRQQVTHELSEEIGL